MLRPGRKPLDTMQSPARLRSRRRAHRLCAGAMTMACALYLASPYMMLWSAGMALQRHDHSVLCASVDWGSVREGLKNQLGPQHPVQQVSQQDELPGFGESFASNVAAGMIDDDVTPERLDTILSSAMPGSGTAKGHVMSGRPRGYFVGPAHFEAEIRMAGSAPIEISMHIEKWRWKITRITLPDDMLTPAATTHLASART